MNNTYDFKITTYTDKNEYMSMINQVYKFSKRQLTQLSEDFDNLSLNEKLQWNYNDWIKFEKKCYEIIPSQNFDLVNSFESFTEEDKILQYYIYDKFGVCYHHLSYDLANYLNKLLYNSIIVNELTFNRINIFDLKRSIINNEFKQVYIHYYVSDDESVWFKAINREYAFEFCSKQQKNNSPYFCKVSYMLNNKVYESSVLFDNL